MKETILVLSPLLPAEMEIMEDKFNVIKFWEIKDEIQKNDIFQKHGNEIKAVVSTYDCEGVGADLMDKLPNLGIIAQFGVGYDNIDIKAAASRNIAVTNTPDVLTDDTADTALMLLLNTARCGAAADKFVRDGKWEFAPFPLTTSISGKKAGIFGMGKIGRAIAKRVCALNADVIYCSRTKKDDLDYRYYPDLEDMATDCDFLILACSGGEETKHIVDEKILKALGEKGFLINIARGSVVNEEDLISALKNGIIAGAGLDVYANEPHVPKDMIDMEQVTLSPHVGSATVETRSIMGMLVIDNLNAFFGDKPLLTPVNTG